MRIRFSRSSAFVMALLITPTVILALKWQEIDSRFLFNNMRKSEREFQLPVLKGLRRVTLQCPNVGLTGPKFRSGLGGHDFEDELGSMIKLEFDRTGLLCDYFDWEHQTAPYPIDQPVLSVNLHYDDIYLDRVVVVRLSISEKVKIIRNSFVTRKNIRVYETEHKFPVTKETDMKDLKEAVRILLTEFCLDWGKANPK